MNVKIERIKIMKRIRKEVTRIEELAADIKMNGLLNPVTVMLMDGEIYQLLAGLRRLKAAQSLGWTEIAVNVFAPADAEAALRIEISENEQRVNFTFSEQMDFARLLEEIEREKAKERLQAGQSNGGKTAGNGRSKEESCSVFPGTQSKTGRTRDIIADKIGMGGTSYERAKYIAENASAEVIEELDSGKRKIRPTYDELRAKAKQPPAPAKPAIPLKNEDVVAPIAAADKPPPAAPKSMKPLNEPPESYMSKQDQEAMRKIREFSAMSAEEKITELQRQLKEERARAAGAESELARLKELRHNDNLHNNANIKNLKMQLKDLDSELTAANARIKEFEDKYEPK